MIVFGTISIILNCYGLTNVRADTDLRRLYELNRDYLPVRFNELGIHGYMDLFAGDRSRSLYVPSDVDSEACLKHSRRYADAIQNYQVWALKMLDSSGRVPSGLLNGHYMDLGNYEECLSVAEEAPYHINYCVVVMRNLTKTLKNWDSPAFRPALTMGGAPFLRPDLRLGICLPASCDLKDLTRHYSNVTSRYNMTVFLDNYSCTSSEEGITLDKMDWLVVVLVTIIGLMCYAATLNDILRMYFNFKSNGTYIDILQCFSFYENGKSLLETTSPEKPLSVLHGIRALSACWIVMAHNFYLKYLIPGVNNMKLTTFSQSVMSEPFLQSELAVDAFLLMSGLLLVRSTIKMRTSTKQFKVGQFYLHHVFRIVPAYFIQLLIALTMFRYLNNGPLWKHYLHSIREVCQESWWTHVTFLNNYIMPEKQCVPSDWYLAVHMQLIFLSPILLIPIYKGKKIVPLVIVPVLFVIANIISISITYFNDYPGTFYVDRLTSREDIFAAEYVPTHGRISPWLLGILIGYFLTEEAVKISKTQAACGWILSVIPYGFIIVISRYIHMEGVEHNLILASINNGLNNTAFAILMAWIIVACETGYGGPLKSLLSWRAFQPISKLSYAIFLTGLAVQYGFMSVRQTSNSMLIIQTYKDIGGELFLIIVFSVIGSLHFEAPFIKLNQIMMKQSKAEKKSEVVDNNANGQKMNVISNISIAGSHLTSLPCDQCNQFKQ
ncbi:nose resistant to fluoxetine protein 6-like [Nilaparvata lugens]|uniref:nose resistant to fluoxetine protein 6-like n=1 Tax=Nilaparvata lugens TaxID=108931 RepID=UPI00193CA1FE|nr:nose resistant to fluoxetine protein 6-like [Nilaparvata lugens]